MESEYAHIINRYAEEVTALYATGATTEHSFRGAMERMLRGLMERFEVVNEPKRSECGAPDFALMGKEDGLPYAYIEAKDLFDGDLRGTNAKGHKEQFDRYKNGLARVAFTDYLEFVFYVDGVETAAVRLLKSDGKGGFCADDGERFVSILTKWADCGVQGIGNATRLAEVMAHKARLLAEAMEKVLNTDKDGDEYGQYATFKEVLLYDLTEKGYADLYAQTVTYGLFAARLNDNGGEAFTRKKASELIPVWNPFLRRAFRLIAGADLDKRIAWIVDDLADVFAATDIERVMGRYKQNSLREDPLIHFYEDFLAAYNPALRKSCGVYYTPQPVVGFIVRIVDEILKADFGLKHGLADESKEDGRHKVQILDPATGTGTFLVETVRRIYKRFEGNTGIWPDYVKEDLLPRLHGFELLMMPYTITHLKLDMMLRSAMHGSDERFNVYLTNSLHGEVMPVMTNLARWMTKESEEANIIKRDCPVMVMMGNPPYSISSSNKGKWISGLVGEYKKGLDERNLQPLSDDYIKFIRLGQHYIERNKGGVLGLVTNNSYLDGIIHRQMRKSLLEAFEDIYIVNLHGSNKRKETAPDGRKDENVFDIKVGVCIAIFVKREKPNKMARVRYIDLYGQRKHKQEMLDSFTLKKAPWQRIECKAPNYFFVPKDFTLEKEYNKGMKITDIFKVSSNGIKTHHDSELVGFKEFDTEYNQEYLYRHFDNRWINYDLKKVERHRYANMHYMLNDNIALVIGPQGQACNNKQWNLAYVSDKIVDTNIFYRGGGIVFPLYLYDGMGGKEVNIRKDPIGERNPEEFMAYIYAVLNSPSYRDRYKEFLNFDFPRVPIPESEEEYKRLAKKGQKLINLHLMRSEAVDKLRESLMPKFPVAGSCVVGEVRYEKKRVWINEAQYFEGVSEDAWGFYVGGYQVAQKWLKDRKGRKLTAKEMEDYRRVIGVIGETMRVMEEIG